MQCCYNLFLFQCENCCGKSRLSYFYSISNICWLKLWITCLYTINYIYYNKLGFVEIKVKNTYYWCFVFYRKQDNFSNKTCFFIFVFGEQIKIVHYCVATTFWVIVDCLPLQVLFKYGMYLESNKINHYVIYFTLISFKIFVTWVE